METHKQVQLRERRTELRKPFRARVVAAFTGGMSFELRALDVTHGGMGLLAQFNVPAQSRCTLSFRVRFKDGTTFDAMATATVAYSVFSSDHDGFKLGVHFDDIALPLAAALARYMNE